VAEQGGSEEPDEDPLVGAAIDVGSTSVHLLVAEIHGHVLEPVHDESAFLRLGDHLSTRVLLGEGTRAELIETLEEQVATARRLGALDVTVVATEPLRRAADALRVVHEAGEATGVPIHVLEHDEEGILTLLGVTGGVPVEDDVVVVDIGGGSSEIVVVGPRQPAYARGIRVGAARLVASLVEHDPPRPAELAALHAEAARKIADAPAADPTAIVVVGGTASNLLKIIPEAQEDRLLTRDRLHAAVDLLAESTAEEIVALHNVRPVRARILSGGAAIVLAILEHYGLDGLEVSEAGIRDGTLFAVDRAGPEWRDQLRRLAQGWGTNGHLPDG
jgi:exopolyphosphatase / guanosine-5'-triphosphate,3'-diphosphate pyrophosphatase